MIALGLLCLFAFVAGFIDAIAGGGGLIQLPAYFILMPGFSITQLLGSNKLGGFSGTFVATLQYLKKTKVDWKKILPALIIAAISAISGARCVSYLDKDSMAPFVVAVLVIMLMYTMFNKQSGLVDNNRSVDSTKFQVILIIASFLIGFYDGFFGPGAGSMLMFVFISLLRFDFLGAATYTKVFNCITNIGALAFFIYNGDVVYHVAIPVAIFNMTGNYIGAKISIKKGSTFIKTAYLIVVSMMIARIFYQYFIN